MTAVSKAEFIKGVRSRLGISQIEFAQLIELGSSGGLEVVSWESGVTFPSAARWKAIQSLESRIAAYATAAPYKRADTAPDFTFIDLFAGVGGIRLPFQQLNGRCVFTSEWDRFAQKTYLANYGELPNGDITKISAADIPDHDILLGGFPCQAFSQAGLKQGFGDTRGTMFFEIQRILAVKRPKAFLLENVKQLKGHDKGRTLRTITDILQGKYNHDIPPDVPMSDDARRALSQKLNYWVDYRVLRAADFGIPQNRERVFIVGFDKDYFDGVDFDSLFAWPEPELTPTKVGDILESAEAIASKDDVYTISDTLWKGHQKRKREHQERGNGFGYSLFTAQSPYANTISARYYKDGSEILIDQSELNKNPRKLTPRECANLQGFPADFIIDAVSHGQIYKQFGNSVCVKVVSVLAAQIKSALNQAERQRQ